MNKNCDYLKLKSEVEKKWFKLLDPLSFVRFDGQTYKHYTRADAEFYFEHMRIEGRLNDSFVNIGFFDIWAKDPNLRVVESLTITPSEPAIEKKVKSVQIPTIEEKPTIEKKLDNEQVPTTEEKPAKDKKIKLKSKKHDSKFLVSFDDNDEEHDNLYTELHPSETELAPKPEPEDEPEKVSPKKKSNSKIISVERNGKVIEMPNLSQYL